MTFNNNVAGTLTPAGKVLVKAGLFTAGQLSQLGGTIETVTAAVSPVNNPNFVHHRFALFLAL